MDYPSQPGPVQQATDRLPCIWPACEALTYNRVDDQPQCLYHHGHAMTPGRKTPP